MQETPILLSQKSGPGYPSYVRHAGFQVCVAEVTFAHCFDFDVASALKCL